MAKTLALVITGSFLVLLMALLSNSLPAAFAAVTHEVDIQRGSTTMGDKAYSPNPSEISKGDSIKFVNKDTVLHSATSGDGATATKSGIFDTGFLGPNRSAEVIIDQTGEFSYYCELHPTMIGIVKVTEGTQTQNQFNAVAEHSGQQYEIKGTSESSARATGASINPGVSVVVAFEGSGIVELELPTSMIEEVSSLTRADGSAIPISQIEESPSETKIKFTVEEGVDSVTITGSRVVPEFTAVLGTIVAATLVGVTLIVGPRTVRAWGLGR